MSNLAKAIALAARVFENKVDKSGKPYILHCLRVMNHVNQDDEEEMQIAILHDVVEDTIKDPEPITIEGLYKMGFSDKVVRIVKILTHDPAMPYDDYIKNISMEPVAVRIKKADLKDNSDITRLKGLRKKDFDRMEKYHKAWVYLTN